eukprot:31340-Pelagococcus_subviridis.AAC.9
MRWVKSLRNGVHHANAVVWEPVYTFEDVARVRAAVHEVELREHAHGALQVWIDLSRDAHAVRRRDVRVRGRHRDDDDVRGRDERPRHVLDLSHDRRRLRVVPYKATSGRSLKASVEVERHRGVSGLKPRGGRRDTPGKVLKDRRSPRGRGRMGTSVWDAPDPSSRLS